MRSTILLVGSLLILFVCGTEAKCENPSNFPVLYYDRYLCSVFYQSTGHPDAFFGCNGEPIWTAEEVYESAPDTQYYPMGSIIVKAGCSFYGYQDFNYQGEKHIFRGPVVLSEAPGLVHGEDGSGNPDGFRSFMCDCDMNYINCVPEDNFEVVLYCDASSASVDTTCRYSKTIGTAFSSTISESMNIDSTIEASMKESFFGIFEATLSTSVTTGYNWGTTSEETKSEQVTVEVEAQAPAGQILTIEQAVGHCDGSSVKTEMYKISHFTPKGQLISSKLVHAKDL